jgi:hypothetical protein
MPPRARGINWYAIVLLTEFAQVWDAVRGNGNGAPRHSDSSRCPAGEAGEKRHLTR